MPGLHTSTGTPRVALAAPTGLSPSVIRRLTFVKVFCDKPGTSRA